MLTASPFDTHRELLAKGQNVVLTIRLHPSSREVSVSKPLTDGSIRIAVKEPPEDDQANEAMIDVLAELFTLPASNIRILAGHTSRRKIVRMSPGMMLRRKPAAALPLEEEEAEA